MHALDWLVARPVAHRGLHAATNGIIENTPSAFSAAVAGHYAIECDLQISADGEAMVHHDHALGRLTEGRDHLATLTAAELKQVAFKDTADRMITLGELCDLVNGRVTLVLEMKSRFDGDPRLPARVADVLKTYRGHAAAMSFDPDQLVNLRHIAPDIPRGIVAEYDYADGEWDMLSAADKYNLAYLLHAPRTRPHFVAYGVRSLPALGPWLAQRVFGRPLLTWTVRTQADRARAERWADQMIFEGFQP